MSSVAVVRTAPVTRPRRPRQKEVADSSDGEEEEGAPIAASVARAAILGSPAPALSCACVRKGGECG